MKIRAVSACCNETAIGITTRMTASTTTGGRAFGSNRNPAVMAAGARAPCSCSKFRPPTRLRTTLWHFGIQPKKPRPARRCCSATGCTGARTCPSHRRWRKPSPRVPASAALLGRDAQYYSWHFAVDFSGGELGALPRDANVEAVITTTHGSTTEHVTAHYVEELKGYRALFDVRPADDSNDAIDLRMYLRIDGKPSDGNVDLSVDPAAGEGSQACAQQRFGM